MGRIPVFEVGVCDYRYYLGNLGDPCIVVGIEGVKAYKNKYADLPANRIAAQRIGYTTEKGAIVKHSINNIKSKPL